MLSHNVVLWDFKYPLYTYGFIFIILLIIWQVTRSYCGLRLEPKRICCQRVARAEGDQVSQVGGVSQFLTVVIFPPSQGWLPQEGSVRRVLCADTCCETCNAMALEIQQLLPESGLRSKMKSFLHCFNSKAKGKVHEESMSSTAGKGANTRKENAEKGLAPAKSSMGQTKSERTRGDSKAQYSPTEKKEGLAFLDEKRWSAQEDPTQSKVIVGSHLCPLKRIATVIFI
uniref:SPATA31-like domain-containing protein n=1 Tax=Neovison vison TaxID=452646 RepID=A0A8C7C540_NEOVI